MFCYTCHMWVGMFAISLLCLHVCQPSVQFCGLISACGQVLMNWSSCQSLKVFFHNCRKGRRQETQKGAQRQHPRNHQTSNQKTGSTWRCETYLWSHIWGDKKCPEGVPGKCYQGCGHIHWARSPQDSDSIWCCLRPQETGKDSVRLWRIIFPTHNTWWS